jgi:hypothetical protein
MDELGLEVMLSGCGEAIPKSLNDGRRKFAAAVFARGGVGSAISTTPKREALAKSGRVSCSGVGVAENRD